MAFVSGPKASRASGGQGHFVPVGGTNLPFVPVGGTNSDKKTLLSQLLFQPGQKAPPRDSSKGSYSILSHVYYLGELARKPCARQEVLGSNPEPGQKVESVVVIPMVPFSNRRFH